MATGTGNLHENIRKGGGIEKLKGLVNNWRLNSDVDSDVDSLKNPYGI